MSAWTTADIPNQTGKIAIVTGANSGIGYYTALELARAGAQVILACRSEAKGEAAVAKIKREIPRAAVWFEKLDLASLASVRAFAARFKATHGELDLLINNAGVMALPEREVTEDGFEMQIGVNFLGHYALTGLLLSPLMKAPAPRTVQVASIAHRRGRIDLGDLQATQNYKPGKVYSQSKLAMLMFGLELQRRSDAGGWGLLSLEAHPGVAATELIANGMKPTGLKAAIINLVSSLVMQSGAAGALPSLYAATSPNVRPGGYYGSMGFLEMRGPPGVAKIEPQALDAKVAGELWDAAERLTGAPITPGP